MNHSKLNEALDQISDKYITEATASKRRRKLPWVGAVAAVLAIAILLTLPGIGQVPYNQSPTTPSFSYNTPNSGTPTNILAKPEYPKMAQFPTGHDFEPHDNWWQSVRQQHNQPLGYAAGTEDFFRQSIAQFLSGNADENAVCSPLNVYMALAMLAETTGNNSRQQILNLLGSKDLAYLRTQAGHVWNAHYWNDGLSTSILANSLWLDNDYSYVQKTVDTLAQDYYASVFQGDLGSAEMNKLLQSWLNEQTGGLLEEQANQLELHPDSSLALASTFYYKVQWINAFWEELNTQDIFHAPQGDREVTYMRKTLSSGLYYWGEGFGATAIGLEDGSKMWLILPDEGVSTDALLQTDDVFTLLETGYQYAQQKSLIINLSLPKFDVTANYDLREDLQTLGVTDVFSPEKADFSPIISVQMDGGYVSGVTHAARVTIDEDGVTAGAFTVIDRAGAAMPPEEEIDFTLNRPFLFVITSQDNLPLFAGVVNNP